EDAGRAREGRDQVRDRRRSLRNRVLELEGLCAARQADLHEHAPGHPVRLIVGEAMRALNHDLVAHPARIGKACDLGRIVTGDARRGLEYESGAGAGGDERRLGAEHAGDDGARRLVELVDVHQGRRGLAHRLERLEAEYGAAVTRGRSRAVNDRTDAELAIDLGDHARPSSFMARTAVSKAVRVSPRISSVWQVPTRARPPLKST